MIRIFAVPMENGLLSSHFGHCQTFAIIKVEDNSIVDFKEVIPPEHEPGLYPKWISQFNVTDVIAGGIGQQAINLFKEQKINVFYGAPLKEPKELVVDFLNNRLKLSANYCDH